MMKMNKFTLLCLCVTVVVNCKASVVTVATYNIWNVMFNWEVRKQYIATKLSEMNVDVAAFQEVRSHQGSSWSQLHELQQLLPGYKSLLYQPVQQVTPPKYGAPIGWEMEGLGILSKLPITYHSVQFLNQTSRLDRNKRVVLHATVSRSESQSFLISVVHLSSDRSQQCNNVVQILSYLRGKDQLSTCSIILGDFNIYNNYEWPTLALEAGKVSPNNRCFKFQKHSYDKMDNGNLYNDVWSQANPTQKGYTFSNMPMPGFESRPDRILSSRSCFSIISSQVAGFGREYKKLFQKNVFWNRYRLVLHSLKSSYYSYSGSLCYFDCGPHASCRCGICVAGGNKNNCVLPNCKECNAVIFKKTVILLALTIYTSINSFCSIFHFLKSFRKYNSIDFIKKLFIKTAKKRRKLWMFILVPFSFLPFIFAIFLYFIIFLGIYLLSQSILNDTLATVNAIIPEEFNPSDHLMVIGQLEFT